MTATDMRKNGFCPYRVATGAMRAGETLRFAAGDRIHTENSYKYEIEEVLALAAPAWRPLHHWCDPGERFSVFLFGC